jgi:predicted aspartyl protease
MFRTLLPLALASLIAAPASAECTLVRIGEFPVRLLGTVPLLPAKISGEKVEFVIGTGANMTQIDRGIAERFSLPRDDQSGLRIYGAGREMKLERVTVPGLELPGAAARSDLRMALAPAAQHAAGIAGVLGNDFWSKADVEFDLSHKRVAMYQARNCDGAPTPWSATPDQVMVRGAEAFQSIVQVEIDGVPLLALIDSATPQTVLSWRTARRLGVAPDNPDLAAAGRWRGFDGRPVEIRTHGFRSFKIGEEEIRNPRLAIADLGDESRGDTGSHLMQDGGWDLLLGADWLNAHRVYLQSRERKMWFTYEGGPVFRATSDANQDFPFQSGRVVYAQGAR